MKKQFPSGRPALTSLLTALLVGPTFGGEVFRIDYDEFSPGYTYSFSYAGYGPVGGGGGVVVENAVVQSSSAEFDLGVEGSSAFRFLADTTALEAEIPIPNSYSYMGFGLGNFIDTAGVQLTSPDLSHYQLDLSLKAAGLLPGQPLASGLVDVRFIAPDGTLQPDDEDGEGDIIFTARYSSAVVAKPEFFENSFRLDRAFETRQGTVEQFKEHFAAVTAMQVVVELNAAITNFGYDDDNEVILDNLVFTDSPPPPPPAESPVVTLDFDVISRSYGGSYFAYAGPEANSVNDFVRTEEVKEVDGSLAQVACLDTSPWLGADPFNGGGWVGFGATNALEAEAGFLPSADPTDYKVAFDIKAEGFVTTPSGKMLVSFFAPDDTLSPADEDTNNDLIVRFRIADDRNFGNGFPLPADFTTVTRNLGDAEIDAGSLENFSNFFEQATVAEFTLEGVSSALNTGFDADNCIMIDNIQLLQLTSPDLMVPTVLGVTTVGPDQLSIRFAALPGHTYSIKSTPDLATEFIEVEQIVATENPTIYSRTEALGTRQFFIVEDLGIVAE